MLQVNFAWPIRQWYNADSPARRACDDADTCERFDARHYAKWRMQGAAVARRVHILNSRYQALVETLWHRITGDPRRSARDPRRSPEIAGDQRSSREA